MIILASKLKSVQEVFATYQEKIFSLSSIPESKKFIAQEVTRKLKYLEFILENIERLQAQLLVYTEIDPALFKLSKEGTLSKKEMSDLFARNPIEDFIAKLKKWDELTFFTESFYYQSFRIGKCVQKLPGLEPFKNKFPSVTFVRNQLTEHPEILSTSTGLGIDTGPILKNSRLESEAHVPQDKGLNYNASEFFDNLVKIIKKF